jgi:hypothetical protein
MFGHRDVTVNELVQLQDDKKLSRVNVEDGVFHCAKSNGVERQNARLRSDRLVVASHEHDNSEPSDYRSRVGGDVGVNKIARIAELDRVAIRQREAVKNISLIKRPRI